MLPSERWALTPPFHPYRKVRAKRRRLAGLPASCHRAAPSGGLSFCGTIRELSSTDFSLCCFRGAFTTEKPHRLKSVLPLPWRYQARCPFLPAPTFRPTLRRWCPDFPPARDCRKLPRVSASQRSPGSSAAHIIESSLFDFVGIESRHLHRLCRNVGGEMGGRRNRGAGETNLPTSTQILIMLGVLIVLVGLLGAVLFFQAR